MKKISLPALFVILTLIFLICILNNKLLNITFHLKEGDFKTKTYETANGVIEYPYFRDYGLDKKIKGYVEDFEDLKGDITFKANIIDKKHLSLLFILPNHKFKSYIINLNNLKAETINKILKKNSSDTLTAKTNEMLTSKYPAFIYNAIINNKGDVSCFIENNQLTVYFSDFNISPNPNEDIFVKINYQEIYQLLNISYTLDSSYINENIYALDPNKKTIALTFDDGPNKSTTRVIYNALKDNKASATFFMLGSRLEGNVGLINDIINSDNEVGSHGYYHKYLTKMRTKTRYFNINEPTTLMQNLFNTSPVYFRPPYGNLTPKIKSEISIPIILWNVDPEDWHYRNVDTIVNNVLRVVKDGDIVLLHDIFNTTAEAVEKLLPELYVRGYQVVSVSKLAELKGVNLEASKAYRSIK